MSSLIYGDYCVDNFLLNQYLESQSSIVFSLQSSPIREEDIENSIYNFCALEPVGSTSKGGISIVGVEEPEQRPHSAEMNTKTAAARFHSSSQPLEPYVPEPYVPSSPVAAGADVVGNMSIDEIRKLSEEIFENGTINESEVIRLIDEERKRGERDDKKITRDRIKLLVKTGMVIDGDYGLFRRGFEMLYGNEIPDCDNLWCNSITNKRISEIPRGLKWLTENLILAYYKQTVDAQEKKCRRVVVKFVQDAIYKMSNKQTSNKSLDGATFLKIMKEFSKKLLMTTTEKCSKLVQGDIMTDSEHEGSIRSERSVRSVAGSRKRPSSDFEREGSIKSVSSYKKRSSPPPTKKAKVLQRFENLENIISASASNPARPPTRLEESSTRHVNFMDEALETASVCSSRISTYSRNSGRSDGGRRMKMNDNDRPASRRSDRCDNEGDPSDNEDGDPIHITPCESDLSWINRRMISIDATREHPQGGNYKEMSKIAFNSHIAKASRSVVDGLITKSIEKNENFEVTFRDTIKNLVLSLTQSILGKRCLDQVDILSTASALKAEEKPRDEMTMTALFTASRLLSLIQSKKKLVTTCWKHLETWATEFSKHIVQIVTRIKLELAEKGKPEDSNSLRPYFETFVNELDAKILRENADLIPPFVQIGNINEIALFILFGLNVKKTPDSTTVTTNCLVKYIYLAWLRDKKNIIELKKGEEKEKNMEIYWSLPLAYAIELHGIGKEVSEEDSTEMSLDDFLVSAGVQ